MIIPISIAENLLILQNGGTIPASRIKHRIVNEMLDNGILKKQIHGRSKATIFEPKAQNIDVFLKNHYGISDLRSYIEALKADELTRAEAILAASYSKLKKVRTFKGFLVNCYSPIPSKLNGESLLLIPTAGAFHFIYDYEAFEIPKSITVVGVENPETFRHIKEHKHLFENIKALFVSRYPQNQSKDLLKWLKSIPNKYLHYGDFDLSGISIYLNEYKKHLTDRAAFFIPKNLAYYISEYGNRTLYNKQALRFDIQSITEAPLLRLIELIQKHQKGLEQELRIE